MKSSRFAASLSCLGVLSTSFLLSSVAAAEGEGVADDLTSKGAVNVNEQRPSLPAVAANSPSGLFGTKGQIAISSDEGVQISTKSTSGIDGSSNKFTLRPAVDYFLFNNVSIGGMVGIDYVSASGSHATTFAIGPRVGYNLSFTERFSFWPKIGFSYSTTSVSLDSTVVAPGADFSASGSHVALNIFAPLMFHPIKHFFVGFGPALDTDLSGDAKQTAVAGRLTIGGYL